MSKRYYVPMKLHSGTISIRGVGKKLLGLPPRCVGILFAFETKKAAKDFMGKDSELVMIEKLKR